MEQVFNLVLKLICLLGAAFVCYLLPKVKEILDAKLDVEHAAALEQIVKTFVLSAEQTIKMGGAEKKAYVEKQLEELGIEITNYVEAMIEQAVYSFTDETHTEPTKLVESTKKTTKK